MRWNPFIHCLFTMCLNQFEPSDRCGRWGRYQLWVVTKHECSTMILLNKIFTPSNLWKVILSLVASACEKILSVSQMDYYYYSCRFQCCMSRNLPLPAMEPTRPTHKGGVTVLRQLEAARVFVPPCLLSEFASQYSDPFLCPGNRKTGNRNTGTALGPLALLHRKRKWWRPCTWECLIWRQNRNRIWNRGRSSPNWTGNGNGGATARESTKFGAKTGTGYGIEGVLALLNRKRKWWHHLTSCTTWPETE